MSADTKHWGGLEPVYVAPYREFAVWPKDVVMSPLYRHVVLEVMREPETSLNFRHLGWARYECRAETCEVDRVYLPKFEVGTMHPYTSQKHTARIAGKIFSALEAMKCDHMICIDLTIDNFLARDISPYAISQMTKAVKDFQQGLHDLITGHKGKVGGWMAIHTWSSMEPYEPKLHAHLVLPNLALGEDSNLHRFSPMLNVRAVRDIWRRVMLSRGWIHELQEEVNLKVRYIPLKERRRCLGRLQYMFRLPRVDIARCEAEVKGFSEADFTFLSKLMMYSTRQRAFGFCTRLKKLGVVVAELKNPPCPICGHELQNMKEKVKFLPDDIPILQFDSAGRFHEVNPEGIRRNEQREVE